MGGLLGPFWGLGTSTVYVLLGMMGVGKSTLARKIANNYNLKFIDIDSKIELKNSMSIKTARGW